MKVSREKLQQIIQEELKQMDEEGELDEVGGFKALGAGLGSLAGSVGRGLAKGAGAVGSAVGKAAGAVGKQVGKAATAVGTQATKAGQAVSGAVGAAATAAKNAKIKAIQDEITKLQGQLTQLQSGAADTSGMQGEQAAQAAAGLQERKAKKG